MHRLVVALTALLATIGAGVVGLTVFLAGVGADQAAGLAPADTAVYLNVYLQPSSGQRQRLGVLAGRFPGFADAATLDDKIEQVVQNLLSQVGVDYQDDIKPWLGNQLAVAADADDLRSGEPGGVGLIAVRDRAAAATALAELAPDTTAHTYEGVEVHVTADATYALLDTMLVVGQTTAAVEEVIDVERGNPSLADSAEFRAAMQSLPADHIATVYVDFVGLSGLGDGAPSTAGYTVLAGALVIEEEGLRLIGRAPFDAAAADDSARAAFALAGQPSSLVEWMPSDTQAEVVIFGLRQALEGAEAAAGESPEGEALLDALTTIRTLAAFGFGIDVDEDVLPLLDREAALALTGLDTSTPRPLLLLRPSDPDAVADLVERLVGKLEQGGAGVSTRDGQRAEITVVDAPQLGTVAVSVVAGIVIVGLSADDIEAAVEAHDGGTGLAGTDAYRSAFELAGDRAGNEAWVDIAALVDATGVADALAGDARDILQHIVALGVTAPSRDDALEFRAVVTVE